MAINYDHSANSHDQTSAQVLATYIHAHLGSPKRIVDWGCGTGLLGKALEALGHTVTYIDGIDAVTDRPVRVMDLTQETDVQTHDVAICLEVGEHLPEEFSDQLVRNICTSADMVFFSGAIPTQGGQNHVNCQWPDWWQEIFAKYGYEAVDIRQAMWHDSRVEVWYRQNMVIYRWGEGGTSPRLMHLIHPDFHNNILSYANHIYQWLNYHR